MPAVIKWALLDLSGVLRVDVSLAKSAAAVVYDALHVCTHMMIRAVEEVPSMSGKDFRASMICRIPLGELQNG